jgi:ElaB/YqjD/DUF883 family membrane-anchored ribosome-binding protein
MIERHNGKDLWRSRIESARGHFDQGFRELAQAAEQAKEQGQDAWRAAQVRAREAWIDVRDKGLTVWDETRERGGEYFEDSQRYVRKNPAQAIGLTAILGVVLGIFLSSSRRSE